MKAAVLHHFGAVPRYEDFPDPTAGEGEVLVHVKAVELGNVDRAVAGGTHYAAHQFMPQLPAVAGFDGIGVLADGRLVGFGGTKPPYGTMAELAAIPEAYTVPIPDGVDAVTAAALPGAALTSLFPLKGAAGFQPGETVLVNGATGFSGRLAIQVAKLLGAGRVVGTGRNEDALYELRELGADEAVDLKRPDDQLAEAFAGAAGEGYGVILDYLWGHPTEVLLKAITPRKLAPPRQRIRLIQIGEMAGPTIALPADALRTSGLEIHGAGAGLTPEVISEGTRQVWDWIKQGKLHADVEPVPLRDVENAWQRTDLHGRRIVIVP
jgi:NADPH2:quinone reductase